MSARGKARELTHGLRVRYAECDPQGVVFNSRYLEYFDIGLTELWREALGSYDEVMVKHGVDIVVAEATVRYGTPLRFDDVFDVRVAVARLGTTAMTTRIELRRGPDLVADGELRHVFVRRGTAAKTPIPGEAGSPWEDVLSMPRLARRVSASTARVTIGNRPGEVARRLRRRDGARFKWPSPPCDRSAAKFRRQFLLAAEHSSEFPELVTSETFVSPRSRSSSSGTSVHLAPRIRARFMAASTRLDDRYVLP